MRSKVAAAFVASLPADETSSETTEGREGFVVNPMTNVAGEKRAVVWMNRCDYDHETWPITNS